MDATAAPERVSSVLRRVGWGAGRETAREKSRRQDVGGRTRTVEHVGTLLRSRPDPGQLQLRGVTWLWTASDSARIAPSYAGLPVASAPFPPVVLLIRRSQVRVLPEALRDHRCPDRRPAVIAVLIAAPVGLGLVVLTRRHTGA